MDPTNLDKEPLAAVDPTPGVDPTAASQPAAGSARALADTSGAGTTAASPPLAAGPPALTAEDIAKAIKDAGLGQTQQPTAEKVYTDDDFNKAFNVFHPTEALIAKVLTGGTDALEAFQEIVHGINKQSQTMAHYQIQMAKDELKNEFSPALTYTQRQQEKELRNEFMEANKDLAGFEPIMEHIIQDLKSKGTKGLTKEQAFKHVADQTRAVIAALPKNGAASNVTTPALPPSKMSTLSSGGQAGSATQGSSAKAHRVSGMEIFD